MPVTGAMENRAHVQPGFAQVARDAANLAPRPRTISETGVSQAFLMELVAKHLSDGGVLHARQMALRCRLAGPIIEDLIALLRREALVEVRRADKGSEALPPYALTDRGRVFALDALARDGYVGPAPVPLALFEAVLHAQSVHGHCVTQSRMHAAFSDTVLRPDLLDRLGAALHSGRAIFIYGPAGSGKSYISRRLSRLLGDAVLVPHSLMVGNTAVRLLDPVVHRPVDEASDGAPVRLGEGYDPRFVLCHRPAVTTGGELTLEMLEVQYSTVTRLHEAPLQLKATNGIYCIDDLGRQRVAPTDLFNRWLVPLESGRDYLSLASGSRFPVSFDVILVFSTNLEPTQLGDEAFLRRIGHKVRFGPLSREDYEKIWRQVCGEYGVGFDPALLSFVLDDLYRTSKMPLLACHPRDLLGMAMDQARYFDGGLDLTPQVLQTAWSDYFAQTGSCSEVTDRIS